MRTPQEEATQFLVSLARALSRNGFKLLPGWSVALVEIGLETWEDYMRSTQEHVASAPAAPPADLSLRTELETLARDTPATVQQKATRAAEQVAAEEPPEVRQALTNYLAQVPAMIRRSLRRPSDPTGTTLPVNLVIRTGEDLVALLPPRPPRFRSGDQPLPGVDWVLEEMLGVGGFGEVWKARHAQLKGLPPVALKFCLDDEAAKTLRHEAGVLDHVMQRGRHEGIVQLRQAYLSANPPCLEYEYVAGGDLAGLIQEFHQKGKPAADVPAKIMQRLAQIIGSVHQQQPPIVHRDLKPANILVQKTPAGKFLFKIADFGIGHVTSREAILTSTRGGEGRSGLLTTRVQGSYTPLYASPQQMRGDATDPRDDVYSLGVIWHQLLTGDLGSGAPSGMQWAKELAQGGVPKKQIDLLASCFESNPAHRPANAAMLAERLRELTMDRGQTRPAEVAPAAVAAEVIPEVVPIDDVPRPRKTVRQASSRPGEGEDRRRLERSQGTADEGELEPAAAVRRKAEAAAFWFLIAAIADLAMIALLLAIALAVAVRTEFFEELLIMLIPCGILGVSALLHFLASGSLRNLRGKGMVITAAVFGLLLALLLGFGMLGGVIETADRGGFALILVAALCGAASFANGFAAIRGILVLSSAALAQGIGRRREQDSPLLSTKFAMIVGGGLIAFFFLVFLIAVVSQGGSASRASTSNEWKK